MTLTLVSNDGQTLDRPDCKVTVSELAVAREYYRFVDIDYETVNSINTLVACGKGLFREVNEPSLLEKIRSVDRDKLKGV